MPNSVELWRSGLGLCPKNGNRKHDVGAVPAAYNRPRFPSGGLGFGVGRPVALGCSVLPISLARISHNNQYPLRFACPSGNGLRPLRVSLCYSKFRWRVFLFVVSPAARRASHAYPKNKCALGLIGGRPVSAVCRKIAAALSGFSILKKIVFSVRNQPALSVPPAAGSVSKIPEMRQT